MSLGLFGKLKGIFSNPGKGNRLYLTYAGDSFYGFCTGNGRDLITASNPREFAQRIYDAGYSDRSIILVGRDDIPYEFSHALAEIKIDINKAVRPHRSAVSGINSQISGHIQARKNLETKKILEEEAQRKTRQIESKGKRA
jgi:hypothetical protein